MNTKNTKIFLINLDRRNDRFNHFMEECKRESLPVENIKRFSAIDGETYQFSKKEIDLFVKSDLDIKTDTGKGCMGNQLSHYYILKDIIKNKYPLTLIFQDDVKLKYGFVKELDKVIEDLYEYNIRNNNNIEILWIGLHKIGSGSFFMDFPINEEYDKYYVKQVLTDNLCILNKDINPASLAYLITLDGAKKYINYIDKEKGGFYRATDINFRDYLLEKSNMYASHKVLCTGNSSFKSDIFKYDDNAIAREMEELLNDL